MKRKRRKQETTVRNLCACKSQKNYMSHWYPPWFTASAKDSDNRRLPIDIFPESLNVQAPTVFFMPLMECSRPLAFLACLRRFESDCRLSWIASRLHQLLLLSAPVGQQGQKKALYEEGVAQAKVPHTRCEKCRERTSSCLRKILLPPLHIKSGLMKNFVKAMDCGGSGFQYLRMKFPKVSAAKIKKGIFVGPQIRQLMKDPVFESKLTKKEAAAYGHHLRR
ncbi:hypothetical protein AVEN_207684-1 [Araneus ventricosus]|uniref:Uncharacterized protein n=1 Tax=Araneus ventricosus TaxID=182803 RepID=A0A4Y2A8D8_ARAVE|nr:hypothetical protein AVEN_207684-1 [Araneus ventricosus]